MGVTASGNNSMMGLLLILMTVLCGLVSAEDFQVGLSSDEIFKVEMPEGANDMGGRTIDEVIRDAGTEEGAALHAGENQQINFQYDMNMDPLQYSLYYGNNSLFAGAALQNDYYRWPKGIIPYQIASSLRGRPTQVIYAAMKEWQEKTCLRFEPYGSAGARKSGHNHKIDIVNSQGCFSMVGYLHRSHQVSLSLNGCIFHGTALHELGHTIGLNHEQCGNDRDKAIKVLFDNVVPRFKYAFNIERGQTDFGIPYDYCSIMQYGPTAFSANREFTVLAKDFDYQWSLGWHQFNTEGLTFSDAKVVNLMYKCNAHCPANSECKAPCYVNHKCECECEKTKCRKIACESRTSKSKCDWYRKKYGVSGGGGDGGGDGGDGGNGGAAGTNCKDKDNSCAAWAARGECQKNSRYMIPNCPKSCELCSNCGNKNARCEEWANRGECSNNPWYMFQNCNKACKLC